MLKIIKDKSLWIISVLILIIIGISVYFSWELKKKQKQIDEIEYTDTTGTYYKQYYEKKFSELKNINKQLYDSLKIYKDKIDYIVQFYHEKEYNTGKVDNLTPNIKDSIVFDTIPVTIPQVAKTYEYAGEPNDTFQYKLNVNSFTEPNWFSINVKTKNKFTIVNKQEGDINQISIKPENGGTITDPTIFKKSKGQKIWDKFSFGPSMTAGYDIVNKQFGIVVGGSITFDLKK